MASNPSSSLAIITQPYPGQSLVGPIGNQALLAAIHPEGSNPICLDLREPGRIEALVDYLKEAKRVIVHDLPWTILPLTRDTDLIRAITWLDVKTAARTIGLGLMAKAPGEKGQQDRLADLITKYKVPAAIMGDPDVVTPGLIPALAAGKPIPPSVVSHMTALAQAITGIATAQQGEANADLWSHFSASIMPAAAEHVIMTANGVRLNASLCRHLHDSIPTILSHLTRNLAITGLSDPTSATRITTWLGKHNRLGALQRNRDGTYHVDDDALKHLAVTFPPAEWLRNFRKVEDLQGRPWLRGMMTGQDGRVHPLHLPMHAATGRSATVSPEIAGIPKWCRPTVWAPEEYGMMELDYVGNEILGAGAYHDEPWLKAIYASGDAISALTLQLFPAETKGMTIRDVPVRAENLRGLTKCIAYGILYGRQPHSIAIALQIPGYRAKNLVEMILRQCLHLKKRTDEAIETATLTGDIPIAYGLVRHLRPEEQREAWKVRTRSMNTPIQATASIIFREATVRAARAIRPLGGRIVMPNHDAILVEGPLGDNYLRPDGTTGFRNLDAIAEAGRQAMIDASLAVFSSIAPLVDVERSCPTCWNKKGKGTSVTDFIAKCAVDDTVAQQWVLQ